MNKAFTDGWKDLECHFLELLREEGVREEGVRDLLDDFFKPRAFDHREMPAIHAGMQQLLQACAARKSV